MVREPPPITSHITTLSVLRFVFKLRNYFMWFLLQVSGKMDLSYGVWLFDRGRPMGVAPGLAACVRRKVAPGQLDWGGAGLLRCVLWILAGFDLRRVLQQGSRGCFAVGRPLFQAGVGWGAVRR